MRWRSTLLALLALDGCRTQLLADSPGAPVACPESALEPLPLAQLSPHDLNLCPDDLVRATFRINLDPCRPLGPVDVAFDAADNHYTVTAHAWRTPLCDSSSQVVERTLLLSEVAAPHPGMVTVRDGAAGGTASLQLYIQQPVAAGQCGSVTGIGCRSDAECRSADPAQRCWYDGGLCQRICFDDADCPDDTPHCSLGFCQAGGAGCSPSEPCLIDQACVPVGASHACRPAIQAAPPSRCTTDGDCGPGRLCRCAACLVPCATDHDCPTGTCDGARGCVE